MNPSYPLRDALRIQDAEFSSYSLRGPLRVQDAEVYQQVAFSLEIEKDSHVICTGH